MDAIRHLPLRTAAWPAQREAALAACAGLVIPLCLPSQRLLTGALINGLLVFGVLRGWSWRQLAPVIVFPVMAASALGWLALGRAGVWLMLLWPGVWLANASLVAALKRAQRHPHLNLLAVLPLAAALKLGVILLACLLLARVGPLQAQVAALPAGQWLAAMAGGAGALALCRVLRGQAPAE